LFEDRVLKASRVRIEYANALTHEASLGPLWKGGQQNQKKKCEKYNLDSRFAQRVGFRELKKNRAYVPGL